MKAIVTGCVGFIGNHLVDNSLELEYEVIGIDCFTDYHSRGGIKGWAMSNALENRDFELNEEDILELSVFPRVDYAFHDVDSGTKIRVNEPIKKIADLMEKRARVKYLDERKGAVRDTRADIHEAEEKINWIPKVKIAAGIKRFVEWWKAEE